MAGAAAPATLIPNQVHAMTRLTIRRGGTRRVRATLYVDRASGLRRDLTTLAALVIDQSPNIAVPEVSIREPASEGELEVLWSDEQTAHLKSGAGKVWLTLGLGNDSGEREVLPTLTFDVE